MMSGLAANGQTQEEPNWKFEFQIPRHPIFSARSEQACSSNALMLCQPLFWAHNLSSSLVQTLNRQLEKAAAMAS